MTSKRPLLLYLMLLVFAVLAIASVLQAIQVLQSANWLVVFGYSPSPIVPLFAGVLFMLLFLVSLASLWGRKPYAPAVGGLSLAVFLIWSWINRLWITTNPRPFTNQIFALGISLFLVLLAEFSLYLLEPFMRRNDEMPQKEEENDGTTS